jgi:hypothetical protein
MVSDDATLPVGDDGYTLPPGDFYAGRGYSFHHQVLTPPILSQFKIYCLHYQHYLLLRDNTMF